MQDGRAETEAVARDRRGARPQGVLERPLVAGVGVVGLDEGEDGEGVAGLGGPVGGVGACEGGGEGGGGGVGGEGGWGVVVEGEVGVHGGRGGGVAAPGAGDGVEFDLLEVGGLEGGGRGRRVQHVVRAEEAEGDGLVVECDGFGAAVAGGFFVDVPEAAREGVGGDEVAEGLFEPFRVF